MKLKLLFFILFVALCSATITAQVTIGSGLRPLSGAILDMKQSENNADNHTATKGVLMPRVKLVAPESLEPTVSDSDPNLEDLKKTHAGLTVYHVGNDAMDAGMYVWNGESWVGLGGSTSTEASWFYMPGFPIDVSQDIELAVNLYDEYQKQFGNVATIDVVEKQKLKFVVLGYDANSFSSVNIDDATSTLKYKANPTSIGSKSYLNIICQILP